MIELELKYDASTAVSLAADLVATSASLAVIAPDGTTLEAPTVTLPSISTTIAAGTTGEVLTLAAVTGIVPGTILRVTCDGVVYVCEAAVVDATAKTVQLVTGLPVIPDTGATVKGCLLTASVAAAGLANIGGGVRLVWTYSDGTVTRTASQAASIVRWPWSPCCTAADVRKVLADIGAGQRADQWCAEIATDVDERVRGALLQTGRRPSLYLASGVFKATARQGILYELAQRGICQGGQIWEAQRELRFAFDDSLAAVIQGMVAYDKDADGKITAGELRPFGYSIRMIR